MPIPMTTAAQKLAARGFRSPVADVQSFTNRGLVGSAMNQTQRSPGIEAAQSIQASNPQLEARQAALQSSLQGHNRWSQQITNYMIAAQQRQKAAAPRSGNTGQVALRGGSGYTGGGKAVDNPGYQGAQQLAGQAGGVRGQIIKAAASMLGTPYAWGGGGAGVRSSYGTGKGTQNVYGVDCSGLTAYVYSQFGLRLPHYSNKQTTMGVKTHINNARPGDLVGWSKGGHVAIYAGNGYIIESPDVGKTVRLRRLRANERVYGVRLTFPGE